MSIRVAPHHFKPLRWWDHLWDSGRCRHCLLPRWAHPISRWAAARPVGDRSPADWLRGVAVR